MVSEARKQSMAWMETDYSKHSYFRWKVKWRLEHLGALGTMGEMAPLQLVNKTVLQQKATVLVSDWLPAVISKSTDAGWCEPSTLALFRSLACWFRFVVKKNKSHTFLRCLYSIDNRWRHKMFKTASGTTSVAVLNTMTSSVINRVQNNGDLYAICYFRGWNFGSTS